MNEEGKNAALETIAELVSDSEISSIKNVTSGIIRIINDPNSNARDLKEIIEIDPPLTAKVLRTANSAYYYSRRHISDIEEAVIWLGFDNLKEIALSQKVCEIFQKQDTFEGYSRIELWRHCIAVAVLAKMIYRMEFGEKGENIYAAGLIHDIGIITEDQFFEAEFKQILAKAGETRCCLAQAEFEMWGYTHADIGKAITESWQFPEDLVNSIAYHHSLENVPEEHKKMTTTLALADYTCHECGFSYRKNQAPIKGLLRTCLDTLKIKKYALDLIVNHMKDEMKRMEDQGLF
jgi:putative nucleotidyltransferase with HDIG domain